MSIWAWAILAGNDPEGSCQDEASELIELLVDMIILTYMRSLRLLSIILFIIICGPLLLVCYFKNRPVPTENPEDLVKNFSRVNVDELKQMRDMNYRHKSLMKNSDRKSPKKASNPSTPVSENGNESLLSSSSSPLESQWAAPDPGVLDSCCICMEDFDT